jgi:outer membrane murein-binding lipoprotein Lpp
VVVAAENEDMEARIARLESDVAHMRADLADIKSDGRALRDRLEQWSASLNAKIDRVSEQLNAKVDKLKDEIHSLKTWALLLYFALAAGMYATLARAFGWI